MKEKEPKPTGRDSVMPLIVGGIAFVIMVFPVGILIDHYLIPEKEYHVEIIETPIVQMSVDQNGQEKFISIRGGEDGKVQFVYAEETENGTVIKGGSAKELSIDYDSSSPRIVLRKTVGFNHWTTWLYALPWSASANADKTSATIYLPEEATDIY